MEKKITLHTECAIDSCHYLNGYNGKCKNVHGHTWLMKLWIRGTPNKRNDVGIIFDFGNINEYKDMIDHQNINEVLGNQFNPTAENLVLHAYDFFKNLYPELEFKVRIYETAVFKKTYAEYGDW